ncbi:2-C-methyl-D-erythritol 4-phosphate cytidylyltransferase [Pelistega sp. NLN82]|uniref:2-C-methyl-D-erythritol 4-phosphate cytidylyltransferase n=2 Tax=Pelistega ratti TaxID=2652177 RepID=A0A6L9Y722_9BURK|nr:2-C-methyl-D-erythritol 4-phosphate cytidylyltransferase [Pelistega ratti]
MVSSSPIVAIIPAGGVGARAQVQGHTKPKQYREIHGKAMLLHSVEALLAHSAIKQVYIGVAADDEWIQTIDLPEYCVVLPTGGATRADTVLNTLKALPFNEETWVMVHDAARPGLPLDVLDRLIQTCVSQDIGGIVALPVSDTVKRAQSFKEGVASPSGGAVENNPSFTRLNDTDAILIEQTISREGLWLAQTPQLFKKGLLIKALETALSAGFEITDEASAIEFIQSPCCMVKGHWRNLKVTWADDFELVEYFL